MTDTDDEPTMRTEDLNYPETLRLTLADAESAFDDALAAADAAERGGEHRPAAVRAFRDVDDLRQLLTGRRLEVLRAVYDDPPDSISALATRLDRAYAVVHEDVQILADHDVVQFREGPRGAKRPYVPYEAIRVDIPLVGAAVTATSLDADREAAVQEDGPDDARDADASEDKERWLEHAEDPRGAGRS